MSRCSVTYPIDDDVSAGEAVGARQPVVDVDGMSHWPSREWLRAQIEDEDLSYVKPLVRKALPTPDNIPLLPVPNKVEDYLALLDALSLDSYDLLVRDEEYRSSYGAAGVRHLTLVARGTGEPATRRIHTHLGTRGAEECARQAVYHAYWPIRPRTALEVQWCRPTCPAVETAPNDQPHITGAIDHPWGMLSRNLVRPSPAPTTKGYEHPPTGRYHATMAVAREDEVLRCDNLPDSLQLDPGP